MHLQNAIVRQPDACVIFGKMKMSGWAQATNVVDPNSAWSNDAYAIDGDINTVATTTVLDKDLVAEYSGGFEDCSHLRILVAELMNTVPVTYAGARATIQAKWDNVWHEIWTYATDGLTANGQAGNWTYITIDGCAAHNVTAIAVIITGWGGEFHMALLYEMDYGRIPKENSLVPYGGATPKNGETNVSKRSDMWTPPFAYADTQKLYWDDLSPPITLRKSEETGDGVLWYDTGENDWQSDTTYHWRVDATNDVTEDVGGIECAIGTELDFATEKACYKVYRGQDGEIDYGQVQAEMDLSDTSATLPAQDLPPNTIWHYVRREVSQCGLESEDSPVCIVMIDADGEMREAVPNVPQSVTIEPLAGAKFRLQWRYTPVCEEIPPTGFKVYMAAAGEDFDFETPAAIIAYGLGWIGEFSWTSGELINDVTYRFCIRSYRAEGGESQNTGYVAAAADSQGPAAITNLLATWEEI